MPFNSPTYLLFGVPYVYVGALCLVRLGILAKDRIFHAFVTHVASHTSRSLTHDLDLFFHLSDTGTEGLVFHLEFTLRSTCHMLRDGRVQNP